MLNQKRELFRACANSVVAQERPIEWIVVDDGSAPASLAAQDEVLRELNDPPFIRRVNLPRNSGLSVARNIGICESKGHWIVILDSDDELAPGTTTMLRALGDRGALVCFAVEYLKASGRIETRKIGYWHKLFDKYASTLADPFLWFDFYYHGMVARRETFQRINGYRCDLHVGEDQDVLLRACESISPSQVLFIDEIGYRYRNNLAGICATRWSEVEANYGRTMVAAARRRGGRFDACRFALTTRIDGAYVDEYEYRQDGRWQRWRELIGHKLWKHQGPLSD